MLYRVFSLNHLGKSGEAMDLLIQDKIIFTSHHKNIPVENHLIHTIHFMLNGKLNHYGYDAKLARDIAKEESHKTIFVLASYYMALSSYIKNDFEEALSYINEVIEIKYSARPYWTMVCYHLKASCLLALKDLEEYQICIVDLTEYVKKFNVPYYKNLLAIMKMEFNLQMEDFKIIPERIISLDFRLSDMVHVYFKPFLTEVKFLLATNIKPNIEQAEILLIQYREKARLTYNRILLLQVNCLHILLLIKQNNSEKALKLLRELLTETKGDGFIRLYTDCGFEMKKLFDLLSNQEKNDVYANQILQSFNLTYWNERFINEIISNNLEPLHLNKSNTNNIKITIREIKLLNLLNLELHNKEIADIINISTDSVKKSLYRLYKKLNVNSRSEALNKATDLNLLRINPKN